MRFYEVVLILMSNIFNCETKMLVLFKIQLNEKKNECNNIIPCDKCIVRNENNRICENSYTIR